MITEQRWRTLMQEACPQWSPARVALLWQVLDDNNDGKIGMLEINFPLPVDFLKILRLSFPVPVVGPRSLSRSPLPQKKNLALRLRAREIIWAPLLGKSTLPVALYQNASLVPRASLDGRKRDAGNWLSSSDARAFSLTWPASLQMFRKKRKRLHKKRVSNRVGLEHQDGRVSLFLNTNMAAMTSCENAIYLL